MTDESERLRPIDFGANPSLDDVDYIRSECNSVAFDTVMNENTWPDGRLLIIGPAQCGKAHLARIWARANCADMLHCSSLAETDAVAAMRGGATVLFSADCVAGNEQQEVGLFHLCNAVAQTGGRLLMTSRRSAVFWPLQLNDLKSRLRGCRQTTIECPDDRLLAALITKLFADRQISVASHITDYILPRMERSFAAAQALVAEMDLRAMTRGRKITRPIALESLAALNGNTYD